MWSGVETSKTRFNRKNSTTQPQINREASKTLESNQYDLLTVEEYGDDKNEGHNIAPTHNENLSKSGTGKRPSEQKQRLPDTSKQQHIMPQTLLNAW